MDGIRLYGLRQRFPGKRIENIEDHTRQALDDCPVGIASGDRIAVAVGSRGIAGIAGIVKTTVSWLRDKGAQPFIVPAMGSHGGATAEGQASLLAEYGVDEKAIGAPVRSTMEVVELDRGELATPVYMDRYAYESDGVVVVNRVKPHTDFHGPTESGLLKICVIGLGKHKQALEIHRHGIRGLRELIAPTARRVLASGKILLGVGLVENGHDQTMMVRAVLGPDMATADGELLAIAKAHMPSLPVEDIDVLVVDEMGKDISGSGMDTNIIGRMYLRGEPEPESPRISSIVVCGLTAASHGNAAGMGFADVVTRRFADKVDFGATYENIITSSFLERGKLPIVSETDKEAFVTALRGANVQDLETARVVRIRNTLHLGEVLASQCVLDEVGSLQAVEASGGSAPMFDDRGALQPFQSAL